MVVLHLEDDDRKARMVHRSLSHLGVEVWRVETWKQFQRAIVSGEEFDLFISDINVPMFEGDFPESLGRAIVGEFRRRGFREDPIVFISGAPEHHLEDRGNVFVYATPDVKDWVAKIEELLTKLTA